jgi:hypothetical protein
VAQNAGSDLCPSVFIRGKKIQLHRSGQSFSGQIMNKIMAASVNIGPVCRAAGKSGSG